MADPKVSTYVEANATRFLDELKALTAIPSVSALSEHRADVHRAAEFLVSQLRTQVGLPKAELIETNGHPLVYGESTQEAGKPTVLIYGHYDVQPVDPVELWDTPPFEPTVKGDNLYVRGAVDDKGPMFATIKALETLMQHGGLPVNIKVLIEGEEEMGGEAIAEYVMKHPDRLQADCALVLDTGMVAQGIPTMSYGLRGIVYFEIVANGAGRDLHSGVYGGIAPNPIQALAWLLADLKGRDGHINVPGLYEMMQPLSEDERDQLTQLSTEVGQRLMDAGGLQELPGEANYSIAERATARPTFEVHGIRGGFTAEGAKTVIPATATAKVSLRLVPDQKPAEVMRLVEQQIQKLTAPGITFEVQGIHNGDAIVLSPDSPAFKAAAAALEDEFGKPVTLLREGGSIPIVALFDSVLKLPVVMMGFSLPDDNVHAPNEKFYIPNYYAAIRSVAGFLQRIDQ
ncbi:MAG: dipeptidase [Chloroflexi bacterium AL-W]|nr:dipeptidase [Chloroflexi bacterium AL-N1]NOK64524.1 dipeptidase [Chloroflexi bacterium AL-N10]NOK75766.1 dipeptidase [Chloroflexi bacterium AL-N5]NOK80475.1 dipeptidase [Chloroflexi bacterium AL-W]NOK86989.1 dipeptidase [Chloroflexi bacterium AL-N15]